MHDASELFDHKAHSEGPHKARSGNRAVHAKRVESKCNARAEYFVNKRVIMTK